MSPTTQIPSKRKAGEALFITTLSKDFPLLPLLLIGLAFNIGTYHPTSSSDLAFVVLYPSYLLIVNVVRFQNNQPANKARREHKPVVRDETDVQMNFQFMKVYVGYFVCIGIIGPAVLLMAAPKNVAGLAAPHLYLLLWQIALEGLTDQPTYAAYVRILVPIGFSVYRTGTLITWVSNTAPIAKMIFIEKRWGKPITMEEIWFVIGAMLAILNFVSWSYNLFVFLLLRMTPAYLDPVEFPSAEVEWKGQLVPVPVRARQERG